MEGVQFDEPRGYGSHFPEPHKKEPAMVRFLINKGIAKSPAAANMILVFVAVAFILVAVILPRFLGSGVKDVKIDPANDPTLNVR